MKCAALLATLCLAVGVSRAADPRDEHDQDLDTDVYGNPVNLTQFCARTVCVRKCCLDRQHVQISYEEMAATCARGRGRGGRPDLPLHDARLRRTGRTASQLFTYVGGARVLAHPDAVHMFDAVNLFLMESGELKTESPNMYDRWEQYDRDHFCIDTVHLARPAGDWWGVDALLLVTAEEQQEAQAAAITGMFLSSVFLLLTLVVYSVLPQLRNLHGKVLMSFCASMFLAVTSTGIFHAVSRAQLHTAAFCEVVAIISYFSILATFFWMNVMSFDIWWTFRGIAKAHEINRRGENHKFVMYCLYGFGAPLAITLVFITLNYLPMERINSAVVTPGITSKGCFLSGYERLFYLYTPMLVLISANTALFAATTCNLCDVRRTTRTARARRADGCSADSTRDRFLLYLKLFVLMGASWVWEVVGSWYPQLGALWLVTDLFNTMSGFFVFVIFVCKKKIYKLLIRRWRAARGGRAAGTHAGERGLSRSSTGTTTTTSSAPLPLTLSPPSAADPRAAYTAHPAGHAAPPARNHLYTIR